MESYLSILNLDYVYENQHFYRPFNYELLDLTKVRGNSLYCGRESLELMDSYLNQRHNKLITFIGSGNYHYITYLLTRKIHKDFSLILFDNHTDMLKPNYPAIISCGSWALELLKYNENLKKIIVLGLNSSYKDFIPKAYKDKISLVTHDQLYKIDLSQFLIDNIPTDNIYITIDKDVLSQKYAITNWDQGVMSLELLCQTIDYLKDKKFLLGADVCGEYSYDPHRHFHKIGIDALAKNNLANQYILESLIRKL